MRASIKKRQQKDGALAIGSAFWHSAQLAATGAHLSAAARHPIYTGAAVLGTYGLAYLGGTALLKLHPK